MASQFDLNRWFFATENFNDDFHSDISLLRVATSRFSTTQHDEIIATYEGTHSKIYMVREESRRVSEEVIERFLHDRLWRNRLFNRILNASQRLEIVFDDVGDNSIKEFTTKELLDLYKKQEIQKIELYRCAWPVEEMHSTMNSIEDRLLDLVAGDKEAYADLLYTPIRSAYSEERWQLCHNVDLISVWKKYRYSDYHGYTNPRVRTFDEYKHWARDISFAPEEKSKERFIKASQRFSEETINIFQCYAELGVAKSYRRLAELKNFYYLDRILNELSCRFRIPEKDIRFMTPEEIQNLGIAEYSYDINRRVSMVYYRNKCDERIITGIDSKTIIDSLDNTDDHKWPIKGMIACPGYVQGRAVIVRTIKDAGDFSFGDIIVSNEPNPELFCLLQKASAIVTDQGGITCHVATIAREMGIPCITGTQFATRLIMTGDRIVVDAYQGEVSREIRNA